MSVKFKSNLKAVKAEHEKLFIEALTRIGMEWLENVTPLVPVDTGRLRQSLTFKVDISKKEVKVGSTILDPEYPIFVELGTSTQRAQPYLDPSIMHYLKDYENAVKSTLGAGWSVS